MSLLEGNFSLTLLEGDFSLKPFSEALHVSQGNEALSLTCWISFRVLNRHHLGPKGYVTIAFISVWEVRFYAGMESCGAFGVQNVGRFVDYGPCMSVRLREELPTWSWKYRLAFISSKSVSGLCFDNFYFITYLCLNEEKKKHTLFQPPKKFALHFIILFFMVICYVLCESLIHIRNIITTVDAFICLFVCFGNMKLKRRTLIMIPSWSVASSLSLLQCLWKLSPFF